MDANEFEATNVERHAHQARSFAAQLLNDPAPLPQHGKEELAALLKNLAFIADREAAGLRAASDTAERI